MYLAAVDIGMLHEPASPVRASIDEAGIAELAESIRAVGLIQPLTVRVAGDDYEVIAGHRRLLACRQIGLEAVNCLIVDAADDGQAVAARLHENLFRRDMTAIEEAAVYAELFERYPDIDQIAAMVHRSRAVVERRLALLGGDPAVRDCVHAEQISTGVAEQLNKITDEGTRRYLLEFAVRDGATVENVRGWRKSYAHIHLAEIMAAGGPAPGGPPAEPMPDPNICWLCGSSEEQHDLRVRLVHQTCERMARRAADERMKQVVSDERTG